MKTILLPFHDGEASAAALDTAYRLASRFGSYLEGLFIRQLPPIMAGEGMTLPAGYLARYAEEGRRLAAEARQRFGRFLDDRAIPLRDLGFVTDGPSAGWREREGPAGEILGDYGRLFDLIVVGRGTGQSVGDWSAMLEGALFESGRPLIVAGKEPPQTLGETIVVVWNGSTETARTLGLGRPLLAGASRIVVLTVEGGTVPGPTGEQLAQHLIRNGLNATARSIEAMGRSAGTAALEEAVTLGADLLVKGAYTHSRLRQMIFGGATRDILTGSELPVLIAH